MVQPDPRYIAEDGAPITHNARMFNYYDAVWVTVTIKDTHADPESPYHQYWDGWFNTRSDEGRSTPLNNQRLAGKPPAWMKIDEK